MSNSSQGSPRGPAPVCPYLQRTPQGYVCSITQRSVNPLGWYCVFDYMNCPIYIGHLSRMAGVKGPERKYSEDVVIAAEDLSVVFKVGSMFSKKDLYAVDHINITVNRSETLAVVGESGSGKTTLGKTLVGLYKPTTGRIYFHGRDVSTMTDEEYRVYRLKSQYIHQDPYSSLNPYKTVYDILAVPLRANKLVHSKAEEEKVIFEALESVGLNPKAYINKYPFELSGGEKQRVSIARALLVKPEFVVADEPVTMLDASLRLEVLDLLLSVQKEMNLSVLFITHDLGMAYYMAGERGRAAVMYLGSIMEFGPAKEMLESPLHPYTQALLSAIPEPDPTKSRSKKVMKLRSLDPPNPLRAPPGCKFSDRCPFAMDRCFKERPPLKKVGNTWVACWLY
ncbi:MAG: ABC transporter ATP-binding protein [Caldivirga sp.]